jgi:ubiquinone/menaquinone biosynthesis C-methylase UbiE
MDRRRFRQKVYDLFSRCYDGFVRLHSGDEAQTSRRFLVQKLEPQAGERFLDLCTGTGEVALRIARRLDGRGAVLGLDISRGMLQKARTKQKAASLNRVFWVQADAAALPLASRSITGAVCSHALYELKGEDRDRAIREVARIVIPDGCFCLMEHAVPSSRIARFLLRLRSLWIGSRSEAMRVPADLQEEADLLAPGGRSWVKVLRRSRIG